MAKAKRKVDPKAVFKGEVMESIAEALEANGFDVDRDGASYGFTKGTILIKGVEYDLQLKPITPKTGLSRYEKVDEDEDEE